MSARTDARAHARARWALLRDRLATITPEAIGRMVLTFAVVTLGVTLSVASWPALAPFLVGAVMAYAVLPIANRLDRYMPRVLAALIAELVALGAIGLALYAVIPPLLNGLVQLALSLPTRTEVQASLKGFEASLGNVEEPLRGIVLAVTTETVTNLQGTLNGLVAGMGAFVANQILGIFGTVSFLLGLLVIPVWVLTLVSDEGHIKRRTAALIAPAIRADVLTVIRIVDRAFGTLLRIRVLLAIVVGAGIWVGLGIADAIGIETSRYQVTGAVLLGGLQLIPELGYFLGFFPILLVLAGQGPVPALTVVAVYIVANRLGSDLVETRVSRGVLDVHPGLLIPAIVVLSQFGVLWLLVAAPLTAILRDTVRYLAGRLSDPPKPAGVLPGDRMSRASAASAAAAPIPSAYGATAAARAGAVRTPSARSAPTTGPSATTIPGATSRSAIP